MPQASNLTINNAAAVAKTFTLLNPASGFGSEARWELQEGAHSGVFPKLQAVCRADSSAPRSKPGTSSVLKLWKAQSVTDSTTGLVSAGPAAELIVTVKMPDNYPESDKNDFVAFASNALAHVDVKAFLRGRVSFT